MTDYTLSRPKKFHTADDVFTVRELRINDGSDSFARFFEGRPCCGRETVIVKCYVDGEYSAEDEVYGSFRKMSVAEAYRLATNICPGLA